MTKGILCTLSPTKRAREVRLAQLKLTSLTLSLQLVFTLIDQKRFARLIDNVRVKVICITVVTYSIGYSVASEHIFFRVFCMQHIDTFASPISKVAKVCIFIRSKIYE